MADDSTDRTEIGPESLVSGEIDAQEDVVIFGRLEGSVRSTATVIVEEGGLARARVEATSVLVAGSVIGDVKATERIEITEKGRVLGDLFTPRLVLQAGGAVRGRVSMSGTAIPEAAPGRPSAARAATLRQPAATAATTTRRVAAPVPASQATRARPARVTQPAPQTREEG